MPLHRTPTFSPERSSGPDSQGIPEAIAQPSESPSYTPYPRLGGGLDFPAGGRLVKGVYPDSLTADQVHSPQT